MKLRNIIYSLSLLVGVLTLGSCVNDDDVCLPDGKTQVIFSLVLQDNIQGTTRAPGDTWGEPADPTDRISGSDLDNKIDLEGLQILVFDSDEAGAFKGTLKDLSYTPKDVTTDLYEYIKYEYVGTAPSDISAGTSYKFVVLANCSQIGNNISKLSDLETLAFTLPDSGNPEYIPMWGVNTATLDLVAGARQNIGTIGLLRAMAKVNIKLEQAVINNGYTIKDVTVTRYNKSGYTLPTGAETATATENLNLDASIHVNPSAAESKTFEANNVTDFSFYLTEYDNWTTADTDARLVVTLTKTEVKDNGDGTTTTVTTDNTFTDYPIQFRDYVKDGDDKGTVDANGTKYNIIRNHIYRFNIFNVTDDGPLYVVPTIADWKDAPELTYDINVATSMRLFDSWLYRYDLDENYDDFTKWATSHMAVAPGSDDTGRPLYSPQIQLVTKNPDGTMVLKIDNTTDFQLVKVEKNADNMITGYTAGNTITIGQSTTENPDVYTYFYIVPNSTVTNRVAKVSLYYNDPALGEVKIPFNYSSLPGYSDDSSEIWVYYFPVEEYNITGKLKMYYQDVNHPLVPTPVQS